MIESESLNEIQNASTDEIINALTELRRMILESEKADKVLRDELLRRHKQTGETTFEGEKIKTIIKSVPYSALFIAQECGMEKSELPDDIFDIETKEIKVINLEKATEWLAKIDIKLEPRYIVNIIDKVEKIDIEGIANEATESN